MIEGMKDMSEAQSKRKSLIGKYELSEGDLKKTGRLWQFYNNFDSFYQVLDTKERRHLERISERLFLCYRQGIERIKTPENISILNMKGVLDALEELYVLEKRMGFEESRYSQMQPFGHQRQSGGRDDRTYNRRDERRRS
jgi:hypothetical protein